MKKTRHGEKRILKRWLNTNRLGKKRIKINTSKTLKDGKDNPEKVLTYVHQRIAARIKRTPKWYGEFDAFVMHEALLLSSRRNATTGIKWHMDHMIPLRSKTASGFHCAANIQVIPEALNVRKRNTMTFTKPHEWVNAL